jgi:hypothetical protein
MMHPLAAPSLPMTYSAALDNIAIGPNIGSCGTAAYIRAPVEVHDIATDPRWANYKDAVLPLGLRACWSSPILDPQVWFWPLLRSISVNAGDRLPKNGVLSISVSIFAIWRWRAIYGSPNVNAAPIWMR